MGTPVLYKPFGSPNSSSPGNAGVLLPAGDYSVQVVGPDGKVIDNLSKVTIPHVPEPGQTQGDFGSHYVSKKPGSSYPPGSVLKVTNGDSSSYVSLKDPTTSLRGTIDAGEGQSFDKPAELPVNPHAQNGGGGSTGVPGQFQPGQVGQYGATPAYIASLFPTAATTKYNPITAAPYTFTDPMKFAQEFGQFNRGEIQKNFDQSKDLALKELDTELSSLQHFVPAASALKRQEVSLDNQFNQAQRTQQVDSALPEARTDLNAQAARARSYAEGRIPNDVQDRAFELGVRSASADASAAGGFGASSSVARKSSDLLSATQRVGLSKYGDQLLSGNIAEKASLFLAPTEYSNAGGQVNVMPSLSSSQLINSNLNAINGLTTISPTTGLQSTTQQNMFTTGQEQQTRQFNAANTLQNDQYNATNKNNFALDLFGYQAGYANSVAGAAQNNINTNFQLQQQQQYFDMMKQYMAQSQQAGMINSLFSGGLGLLTAGVGSKGGGGSSKGGGGGGTTSFPGTSSIPGGDSLGGGLGDITNNITSHLPHI